MSHFKDHFSGHAKEYKKYRPEYPPELYAYLASLCSNHENCWDVGTGNGQAAIAHAKYFKKVLATDASSNQIRNATQRKNVTYMVSPAESCPNSSLKFDLITVAQAAHWFDLPAFYSEIRRVANNNAILAIWTYSLFTVDSVIDEIVGDFYQRVIGKYWPPERRHVENGYEELYFPWDQIDAPSFYIEREYSFDALLAYIETWSAVKNYKKNVKSNPIELIAEKLKEVWGSNSTTKLVTWPIHMKIGLLS